MWIKETKQCIINDNNNNVSVYMPFRAEVLNPGLKTLCWFTGQPLGGAFKVKGNGFLHYIVSLLCGNGCKLLQILLLWCLMRSLTLQPLDTIHGTPD